jgi:hypothetical protein
MIRQKSIFDGRTEDQKIQDAIDLLRQAGYLVRGPLLKKSEISTPHKLVQFFYDCLEKAHPDNILSCSLENKKRDLSTAKRLVDSRISLGVDKKRAFVECCELIEVLFNNESDLGLRFSITSMSIFGQDEFSWLTEKLISIYNGMNIEISKRENDKWYDSLYEKLAEQPVGEKEYVEATNKLDRMLCKNGEEKRSK